MNENKIAKRSAIVRLMIWLVVGVILVGVLCVALMAQGRDSGSILNLGTVNFFNGEVYADPNSYNVGNRTYSEKVSDIDISWASGRIDLAVWDGDEVKIEESGAGENEDNFMRSKVEGGKLIIKFVKSGRGLFKVYPEKTLKVYLPEDIANNLNVLGIDTASGAVSALGISAKTVDIDTASGNVDLEGIFGDIAVDAASAQVTIRGTADDVEVSAASGDLDIRGEFNSLELDAVSGNVIVETFKTLPVKIDVEAVSGNIAMTLPDIESGFEATIDTVSGRLTSNIGAGQKLVHGDGIARYDFESVSGNVNITVKIIPNTRG